MAKPFAPLGPLGADGTAGVGDDGALGVLGTFDPVGGRSRTIIVGRGPFAVTSRWSLAMAMGPTTVSSGPPRRTARRSAMWQTGSMTVDAACLPLPIQPGCA